PRPVIIIRRFQSSVEPPWPRAHRPDGVRVAQRPLRTEAKPALVQGRANFFSRRGLTRSIRTAPRTIAADDSLVNSSQRGKAPKSAFSEKIRPKLPEKSS